MNKAGNQRGKDTEERIEAAFLVLLAQKPPEKITIRELCENISDRCWRCRNLLE